ncbi:MAG TPA: c-type cytochrome [Pelomicrobium sp.]|nr:c-type cytochrome [Pelomicrobium sp.]
MPRIRHALACSIALAAFAMGAPADAAPRAGAAAIDPALIYHNYCSVCHGDKGDGKSRASGSLVPPPYDFTSERARRELTRDRVIAMVTHGKSGTAMVGWSTQLNEREIAALADYVLRSFVSPKAAPRQVNPRGRKIYTENCAVCHGDDGRGGRWAANLARQPRDFTSPAARNLTRETMIAVVTNGRPGTPMAGFASQLSSDDIAAAVDFVRAAFMAAATPAISGTRAHGGREADAAGKANMEASFAGGLRGDYERGGRFYNSNCATCHGVAGDGKGPRAYFIFPKPRNFLENAFRDRFNRPALYGAIAHGRVGTEMPAWDKVLNEQEIADVAEYVFRAFVKPAGSQAADARR